VRGLPKFDDPNLIVGAESFSDAGVYRLRDDLYLVQTVDFFPPLVDDPYVFGQIAAANALSDALAMGARPITALNLVGFPDKELALSVLDRILAGGAERVLAAGAVVVGGHSVRDAEVKYGLAVTGVVEPAALLTNAGAQPGDLLVLTKALGTGCITTAAKKDRCPRATLDAAIASMIQLNDIGRDAAHAAGAHAVTDVTGFGLAGHAAEMARASGVTIELQVDALPELPGALQLLQDGFKTRANKSNREFLEPDLRLAAAVDDQRLELVFDPQTSGGLLISVAPARADQVVQQVRQAGGGAACVIGAVRSRQDASLLVRS
jgi:selenide, water dikinase